MDVSIPPASPEHRRIQSGSQSAPPKQDQLKRDNPEVNSSQATTNGSSVATATTASTTISDAEPTVINAPVKIGIIMPNPGGKVYTGDHRVSRNQSLLDAEQHDKQESSIGWDMWIQDQRQG